MLNNNDRTIIKQRTWYIFIILCLAIGYYLYNFGVSIGNTSQLQLILFSTIFGLSFAVIYLYFMTNYPPKKN